MKLFGKWTVGRKKENINAQREVQLVTRAGMPFGYVEAYKSLRTNLKFVSSAGQAKSFVITSAVPMESKSNVSVNLAVTLAEEGKKVILIDGDLRKPAIHTMLGIAAGGQGLSGLLSGTASANEVLRHHATLNIDVVPVGAVPPNPAELLSQERMIKILEVFKQHYDYVIIDAPPVSVVTDAAVIGGMVDGALLVVRSDYAPREMVQQAKKKLEDVQVKIFGVVLTRYKSEQSGGDDYNYYGYGS